MRSQGMTSSGCNSCEYSGVGRKHGSCGWCDEAKLDAIEQNILFCFPVYVSRRLHNKTGEARTAALNAIRADLIRHTANDLSTDDILEISRLVEWVDYTVLTYFATAS